MAPIEGVIMSSRDSSAARVGPFWCWPMKTMPTAAAADKKLACSLSVAGWLFRHAQPPPQNQYIATRRVKQRAATKPQLDDGDDDDGLVTS